MSTNELPEKLELLLLATLRCKITNAVTIGDTVYGEMIYAPFEGDLSGDILSGKMSGTNYALVRADGIHEVNLKGIITTDDKANLEVTILGNDDPNHPGLPYKDVYVKIVSDKNNEKYNWLNDAIIVGLGQALPENLYEYKYYYYR